jgi:hypothetical protein
LVTTRLAVVGFGVLVGAGASVGGAAGPTVGNGLCVDVLGNVVGRSPLGTTREGAADGPGDDEAIPRVGGGVVLIVVQPVAASDKAARMPAMRRPSVGTVLPSNVMWRRNVSRVTHQLLTDSTNGRSDVAERVKVGEETGQATIITRNSRSQSQFHEFPGNQKPGPISRPGPPVSLLSDRQTVQAARRRASDRNERTKISNPCRRRANARRQLIPSSPACR